jgi:hypothetical protein
MSRESKTARIGNPKRMKTGLSTPLACKNDCLANQANLSTAFRFCAANIVVDSGQKPVLACAGLALIIPCDAVSPL